MTNAVIDNIKEICNLYVKEQLLLDATNNIQIIDTFKKNINDEIVILNKKVESVNNNIDKLYMDKVNRIITDEDFMRISKNMVEERQKALIRLNELDKRNKNCHTDNKNININKIVEDFLNMENPSREILCELIDRIELTKDKQLIINYSFKELDKITMI